MSWRLLNVIAASVIATPSYAAVHVSDANQCSPTQGVAFICGVHHPEDLVKIPQSPWVIASGFSKPQGNLYLVHSKTHALTVAYPSDAFLYAFDRAGYPGCPGLPDRMVPHGLDIERISANAYRLLVANNGDRQSVEIIDVEGTADGPPRLTWRGCIMAPPQFDVNAVASLGNGSMAVTTTYMLGRADAIPELLAGRPSGAVAIWQSKSGWTPVSEVQIGGANGVVKYQNSIIVAGWGDSTINIITPGSASARTKVASAPAGFRVDNLRKTEDGRIYAAGLLGSAEELSACFQNLRCPFVSVVATFDPRTKTITQIFTLQPIPDAFESATAAIAVNDEWWIGSFVGDRIAILRASASKSVDR